MYVDYWVFWNDNIFDIKDVVLIKLEIFIVVVVEDRRRYLMFVKEN